MQLRHYTNKVWAGLTPKTSRLHTLLGSLSDLGIIAEAVEPGDFRFPPKPCHLPFRIIAMRLLGRLQSLIASEFSTQELHSLFVTERVQRPRRPAVFLHKPLCLFDQAALEHLASALINALVERGAVGIETDSQDAKAL